MDQTSWNSKAHWHKEINFFKNPSKKQVYFNKSKFKNSRKFVSSFGLMGDDWGHRRRLNSWPMAWPTMLDSIPILQWPYSSKSSSSSLVGKLHPKQVYMDITEAVIIYIYILKYKYILSIFWHDKTWHCIGWIVQVFCHV